MKVSILIPYFQGRRSLLERTLWLLRNQTYDNFDVWIIDDGSDEHIEELCGGNVIYEKLREPKSTPRSSNTAWRHAYEISDGDFVILTHPEYMAPVYAIERLIENYDGSARLEPTAYALSHKAQSIIDTFDWKEDIDVLQRSPRFWNSRTPWGWTNLQAKDWCHHFAFTGQDRAGWDLHDFLPDAQERGMNDSWLVKLEQKTGRVPRHAGFAVYHQNHERTSKWPFPQRSIRVQRTWDSLSR